MANILTYFSIYYKIVADETVSSATICVLEVFYGNDYEENEYHQQV